MNAIFIHIPKTAGLSIEKSLELRNFRTRRRLVLGFDNKGMISIGHLFYLALLRKGWVSKEFGDSAWKFCFCRNPYDRAVSHFFYTRRKHPELVDPALSFLEFTRNIPRRLKPQFTWIRRVDVDFIGRFENLEKDFMIVAKQLGRTPKGLVHENSSKHEPYQTYYCDESRANIAEFYKEDFERFGYKP